MEMKQARMLLNPDIIVTFRQLKSGDYRVTFPKRKGFKYNVTTLDKDYFEQYYKVI